MTEPKASLGGSAASVVEILEKARGRVARGWRQGGDGYGDPDANTCCALGAIRAEASLASELWWDLFASAADLLRAAAVTEWLPEWNDTPGRTQAEVLAAFDRAIEDASKTPSNPPSPEEIEAKGKLRAPTGASPVKLEVVR